MPALVALSLFYVGGMYLNDAFDREIDARERPGAPDPVGAVQRRDGVRDRVRDADGGLRSSGGRARGAGVPAAPGGRRLGGLGLGAAIVLYDWRHKGDPLSPVLMGLCRVLVYVTAALATARLPAPGRGRRALLLCYLIGLTYAASQETLWRGPEPLAAGLSRARRSFMPPRSRPGNPVGALVLCWIRRVGRSRALGFWCAPPGDVPRAVIA